MDVESSSSVRAVTVIQFNKLNSPCKDNKWKTRTFTFFLNLTYKKYKHIQGGGEDNPSKHVIKKNQWQKKWKQQNPCYEKKILRNQKNWNMLCFL